MTSVTVQQGFTPLFLASYTLGYCLAVWSCRSPESIRKFCLVTARKSFSEGQRQQAFYTASTTKSNDVPVGGGCPCCPGKARESTVDRQGHVRWARFLSYTEAQEERREVPLASFVVASKILYGKVGSFER